MQPLDSCPLCRTVLPGGSAQCPGCGADLRPYLDVAALADRYLKLARELLSRGDTERVRQIVACLPLITSEAQGELAEIAARLAILEGNFAAAEQALAGCEPLTATAIRHELAARRQETFRARELYNHALAAARDGSFILAARQLEAAVQLDADDPKLWALKLKVDLKCRDYRKCYRDLNRLDKLAARPPEFFDLEELLPATAPFV